MTPTENCSNPFPHQPPNSLAGSESKKRKNENDLLDTKSSKKIMHEEKGIVLELKEDNVLDETNEKTETLPTSSQLEKIEGNACQQKILQTRLNNELNNGKSNSKHVNLVQEMCHFYEVVQLYSKGRKTFTKGILN